MDKRWNKTVVSPGSWVMTVMCRLISCTSSTAMTFYVLAISMATGQSMCVLAKLEYFILCCTAWSAATPGMTWWLMAMWDSAYLYGNIPCQRFAFGPWEESGTIRVFVIFHYQTDRLFRCLYLRLLNGSPSYIILWALLRQDSPCSPHATTHTRLRFIGTTT